jgi:deoxyribonuclease V
VQVTGGDRKHVCAAVDVHYIDAGARAAVVTAADPTFAAVLQERTLVVPGVPPYPPYPPYRPGEFYLRELPPIRAVLGALGDEAQRSLIVVDGYVDLDPDGRPGLGAYVHAEFGVPVIGVAKSAFQPATHAIPVLRGTSARPLFVTAAGMPRTTAAELVSQMAGSFRLPDALRRVDSLARGA